MVHLEFTPGRTCTIDGKEYLFFSGYAYLGMNHVKAFAELVKEGIDKYGLLFPSSRISNTRLTLYHEFEHALSLMNNSEKTVSFSSGFLAGITIADILSSYKNIFVAPATHPAIFIKSHHEVTAKNFNEWTDKVIDFINACAGDEFVLVYDAVNIFTGEVNDSSFLQKISSSKKLYVLADTSHAFGLGKRPAVLTLPQRDNIEYILSYSLSKALNLAGGAVSCPAHFAEKLRQHPNYSGSTAISLALINAFLQGKNLYQQQQKKLSENVAYLQKIAGPSLLKNDFGLSIFICQQINAEEFLFANNIIISSFHYPLSTSSKVDRIIVSALHTVEDLDRLFFILAKR